MRMWWISLSPHILVRKMLKELTRITFSSGLMMMHVSVKQLVRGFKKVQTWHMSCVRLHYKDSLLLMRLFWGCHFSPSNAEATLVLKAQGRKDLWKPSTPCHVGIHWKALVEYSQMSTHMPRFQSLSSFFASFCIGQISHLQHKG